MAGQTTTDFANIRTALRNCYLLVAFNTVWLLIPAFGIVLGNNLHVIVVSLAVGGFIIFVSNTYIAKKLYYLETPTKGSLYESHLHNVDNAGFVVFFVTLVTGLLFVLLAVFVLNAFTAQSGYFMFLTIDTMLSAFLGLLAFWVLKHAIGGLWQLAKPEEYTYHKIANIF
jgi:hypothetical protein